MQTKARKAMTEHIDDLPAHAQPGAKKGAGMTMEERVEEAIVALWPPEDRAYYARIGSVVWMRETAAQVLAAAFPELFSSPPTAWIAPMEPSGVDGLRGATASRSAIAADPLHCSNADAFREGFLAMRDAHLGKKDT